MSWLAFSCALTLFICLLLTIPLQCRMRYRRVNQDDAMTIDLTGLLGLWNYTLDIPMFDWRWALIPHLRLETATPQATGGKKSANKEIKPHGFKVQAVTRLLNRAFIALQRLRRVKAWFYRGVRCLKLSANIEVGFRDAALTGIAVGGLWSIIGYYLGKLHTSITFQIDKPEVVVRPSFQRACVNADIDCIFKLRLGHIIIAGLKLRKLIKLGIKGAAE